MMTTYYIFSYGEIIQVMRFERFHKMFEVHTGDSRLMRISLLRFFKTITKIWLMRFYGLFILLLRT